MVRVEGDGRTASWRGFTVYFGYDGEATITGRKVGVLVIAENISMHVAGKGIAYLQGRGNYFVNGRGPFPWSPDGAFAGIHEPEAAP